MMYRTLSFFPALRLSWGYLFPLSSVSLLWPFLLPKTELCSNTASGYHRKLFLGFTETQHQKSRKSRSQQHPQRKHLASLGLVPVLDQLRQARSQWQRNQQRSAHNATFKLSVPQLKFSRLLCKCLCQYNLPKILCLLKLKHMENMPVQNSPSKK